MGNAPGAVYNGSHGQRLDCPKGATDYCCTGNTTEVTSETLPSFESGKISDGGYWFSFPRESEGKTWRETIHRRINGSCIGNAWRQDAGGCTQCGSDLDQCVAECIQAALVTGRAFGEMNYAKLRPSWDRAFNDKTFCPDEPFPSSSSHAIIV